MNKRRCKLVIMTLVLVISMLGSTISYALQFPGTYTEIQVTTAAELNALIGSYDANKNFGIGNDFNLLVFGDCSLTNGSISGRAAIGGNANIGTATVGNDIATNSAKLIVGGNLTMSYATTSALVNKNKNVVLPQYWGNKLYISSLPVMDFAAAKTKLQRLSAFWSTLPANGIATVSYSTLNLVGKDPILNIFNIDATMTSKVNSYQVSVPVGSAVLINLAGENISMTGGFANATDSRNTVINAYSTTAPVLNINGISILGSVLAPNHTVNFVNGNVSGNLIANKVTQLSSFSMYNSLLSPALPVGVNHAPTIAVAGYSPTPSVMHFSSNRTNLDLSFTVDDIDLNDDKFDGTVAISKTTTFTDQNIIKTYSKSAVAIADTLLAGNPKNISIPVKTALGITSFDTVQKFYVKISATDAMGAKTEKVYQFAVEDDPTYTISGSTAYALAGDTATLKLTATPGIPKLAIANGMDLTNITAITTFTRDGNATILSTDKDLAYAGTDASIVANTSSLSFVGIKNVYLRRVSNVNVALTDPNNPASKYVSGSYPIVLNVKTPGNYQLNSKVNYTLAIPYENPTPVVENYSTSFVVRRGEVTLQVQSSKGLPIANKTVIVQKYDAASGWVDYPLSVAAKTNELGVFSSTSLVNDLLQSGTYKLVVPETDANLSAETPSFQLTATENPSTAVWSGTLTLMTPQEALGLLTIESVTPDKTEVFVNDVITYTVVIKNSGDADLTNVTLYDSDFTNSKKTALNQIVIPKIDKNSTKTIQLKTTVAAADIGNYQDMQEHTPIIYAAKDGASISKAAPVIQVWRPLANVIITGEKLVYYGSKGHATMTVQFTAKKAMKNMTMNFMLQSFDILSSSSFIENTKTPAFTLGKPKATANYSLTPNMRGVVFSSSFEKNGVYTLTIPVSFVSQSATDFANKKMQYRFSINPTISYGLSNTNPVITETKNIQKVERIMSCFLMPSLD